MTLHDDVPEGVESEMGIAPLRLEVKGRGREAGNPLGQLAFYGR
jgi:hypothetical protein